MWVVSFTSYKHPKGLVMCTGGCGQGVGYLNKEIHATRNCALEHINRESSPLWQADARGPGRKPGASSYTRKRLSRDWADNASVYEMRIILIAPLTSFGRLLQKTQT
jgi:hypothetical protein